VTIPESIQDFAVAAVATQRRLNEVSGPLAELTPVLQLSEFTVESRCLVSRESSVSFGLAVQPVNLSFEITHRLRRETLCRIAVTITQTAAAAR
jgi:hypothetical protein